MAYVDADELARVLRLRQPTEAQGTALQRVLDTAYGEIGAEIGTAWPAAGSATWPWAPDTPDPAAGALLAEVNLERAVEHWQQEEAPFGVIGLGEAVPTVTANDSFRRHAAKLAPMVRSWGIA